MMSGARGRTRTGTPVKASGPKPGASTNFATRARHWSCKTASGPRRPPQQPGKMRILAGGATAIGLSANLGASIAWRASCGSAVETTSPPMMATAIGPQNTLRDGGIRDRHRRRQDGRLASAHRTLDHRTRAWRGLGAITPSGATVASSGTCRPQLHRPPSCARREGARALAVPAFNRPAHDLAGRWPTSLVPARALQPEIAPQAGRAGGASIQ
jgi:hypothetical protein